MISQKIVQQELKRKGGVRFGDDYDYSDLRANYKQWLDEFSKVLLSKMPRSQGKTIGQILQKNDMDKFRKLTKIVSKADSVWYEFEAFMKQELK